MEKTRQAKDCQFLLSFLKKKIFWVEETSKQVQLKNRMLPLSSRFHCSHYFWIDFIFKRLQYILIMSCHDIFSDVSLLIHIFLFFTLACVWSSQRWYLWSLILLPSFFQDQIKSLSNGKTGQWAVFHWGFPPSRQGLSAVNIDHLSVNNCTLPAINPRDPLFEHHAGGPLLSSDCLVNSGTGVSPDDWQATGGNRNCCPMLGPGTTLQRVQP